jgi:ubiquinone/menaquinone biosynthesis C-methylase UbiE
LKLSFSEHFRAIAQEPFQSVRKMGIVDGQRVVDVGAGLGYFTVPAAQIVGASGFVFAVEPDPQRSQRVKERIASEGLPNVQVITTSAEKLGEIMSDSIDMAFSAFTLHHFNDREEGLSEIRRVLRQGGIFYIWDRVPGMLIRHGTRPEELNQSMGGFSKFELLSGGRTLRARFIK